ncbi:MAG TPA: efflux RND transporter periplasmic adaptor subunit [Pseudidiomarina sp.]|nr:efflux RND transporter periplasmic adaptor subunit [Pseudidiomarina sp.]
MSMRTQLVVILLFSLGLSACSGEPESLNQNTGQPVRVVSPTAAAPQPMLLSGIVKSRTAMPLAFEVNGRIGERLVNAGTLVAKGQPLMRLVESDLEQQLRAEQAGLDAAKAAEANAQTELTRVEELIDAQLVSEQQRDQAQLVLTQAQQQLKAQRARLQLAQKALSDTQLLAPAEGILIEFTAEQDQVISRGQPVAMFAVADQTEIEVLLPPKQSTTDFETAELLQADGTTIALQLRETAGALDASGRTLRARYQLMESIPLPLNSVVKVRFPQSVAANGKVPLSAIDGRCSDETQSCTSAQVWEVRDGAVYPIPITVVAMDGEYAYIQGDFNAQTMIVAAGTHVLTPEMAVRVLPQ